LLFVLYEDELEQSESVALGKHVNGSFCYYKDRKALLIYSAAENLPES